jgi:hypothetical protein
MKQFLAFALALIFAASSFANPAPQANTAKAKPKRRAAAPAAGPSVSEQLNSMKQAIEAQQQQIQQLRQELQTRDQAVQQLQQRLDQSQSAVASAESKADSAAAAAAKQDQAVTQLTTDVSDLKLNQTNEALSLQETQKTVTSSVESPVAIHYKGVTITPVAWVAAETVYRQHATGSDINTPFNSIPFAGSAQNNLSEFFGTGRQSRLGLLGEGKLKSAKLTGYYEADFLSAGLTSNNNESNSYTLRQRQAWGQGAFDNGVAFTGGQMWSLVTETKSGLSNRTEATPMTIDPQYTVGFSWARQYGFRFTKAFGNKLFFGASVENAQATFTAHNQASPPNFVIGSAGTNGGLYNASATYSFNPTPDFVFKLAMQPGSWAHFEVFGLISDFRDRIYPCATVTATTACNGVTGPSAAGATNKSTQGWGMGGNIRFFLAHKHLDIGAHFLGGDGVGRYGTSTLSDATIRPDGEFALLRSYQGLGTVELHFNKFDLYANVGSEYAGRNWVLSGTKGVGYGSPLFSNAGCFTELPPAATATGLVPTASSGFTPASPANCTGDTKDLVEGTVGFWYRFYKGPKGTLQWGPQYSYIVKNVWSGVPGTTTTGAPAPTENMFMTSFRYYLP